MVCGMSKRSSPSTRWPRRASCQAVALPMPPMPTTITSNAIAHPDPSHAISWYPGATRGRKPCTNFRAAPCWAGPPPWRSAPRAFGQTARHDLLIKGGEVVDPSQGLRGRRDVAIRHGLVVAVEAEIPASAAAQVIEAGRQAGLPGLVDLHAHVYPEVSAIGLPADDSSPGPPPPPMSRPAMPAAAPSRCSAMPCWRGRAPSCSASSTSPMYRAGRLPRGGRCSNIDNAIVGSRRRPRREPRRLPRHQGAHDDEVVGTNGIEPLKRAIRRPRWPGPGPA